MATALVQLDNGLNRQCSGWNTLGGSNVVQLVITSSSSITAQADAQTLYDALLMSLSRQRLQREPTRCGDTFGAGAYGCWATRHSGDVRRILVWVTDQNGGYPVVDPPPSGGVAWTSIIPLLPEGTSPKILGAIAPHNVARWFAPDEVATMVPEILVAAGISAEQFRVFISYRWEDAQGFAEQLFDGLSHACFDVYLDRFRTGAGTNFVERIRAELADKACVVLLDSAQVGNSSWVAQEYAFARAYRLGLMAIDLPGGNRTFPRIGSRLDLSAAQAGPRCSLNNADVQTATKFVISRYSTEISRRYRHQRRLIMTAAALAGTRPKARADGLMEIGATPYIVAASARPPDLGIVRVACQAASAPARAAVVGPLFAQTHNTRQDMNWLEHASGSALIDERGLLAAMRRMKAGTL